jgi:acetoin utilization deacetylase AcuC-like enzyme
MRRQEGYPWGVDIGIIWHEASAEHITGSHPEGEDRVSAAVAHLQKSTLWPRLSVSTPGPATEQDLLRVHTADHVSAIRSAAANGGVWIDPDTYVSAHSYHAALLAAGGAMSVTEAWDKGVVPFALVRPPGHHATPGDAMGFCLFNNIAVTAAKLLDEGLERVAIIDWDVHHGNGTQDIFYGDPRVLFISMHQSPHYPGTGSVLECGAGRGAGYTVNIPMPAWCNDNDYAHAFEMVVEPVVKQFEAQAILVSAGQDIHQEDPLGDMNVSEVGFAQMGWRCARMSKDCDGRLAFILEGGYNREATANAIEAVLRAVEDGTAPPVEECSPRGGSSVSKARVTQAAYWYLW